MTISVHTNKAALTALQNLNKTNDELGSVQERVNTGLKIGNAKDNAAIWAIAQGQRADIGALGAVRISLERANSIAEVSLTAGESISDLLVQLKEKVVSAMDTSLDVNSRTALDSDFKAILRQITQVIQNSAFDGANLFSGAGGNIQFLANAEATSRLTLSTRTLALGGSNITIPANASITTAVILPSGASRRRPPPTRTKPWKKTTQNADAVSRLVKCVGMLNAPRLIVGPAPGRTDCASLTSQNHMLSAFVVT